MAMIGEVRTPSCEGPCSAAKLNFTPHRYMRDREVKNGDGRLLCTKEIWRCENCGTERIWGAR